MLNSRPFLRPDQLAAVLGVGEPALGDTGLRRSEVLRLEWRDVDLRRSVLLVRKSKNSKTREIPLTGAASDAFSTLVEQRTATPISGPDLV